MRRYDSAIFKTQMIYTICFVFLFWIVLFVIPDYVRAMSCTEHAYATVIEVEENYLMNRPISYNYTLRIKDDKTDRSVNVSGCRDLYGVGDVILIEYRPDGSIYRIPNNLY